MCVAVFSKLIMLFVKDLVSSEKFQVVKNPTVQFRRRLPVKTHHGQVVRVFHQKM